MELSVHEIRERRKPGVRCMPVILELGNLRQEYCPRFEANLGYMMNSGQPELHNKTLEGEGEGEVEGVTEPET